MSKDKNPAYSSKGKLIEIDGVQFQVINGKLCRYADLTLDKGFKVVLGRYGSEEVLKNLLNRILGMRIARLEYRNTEHPGMTEEERSSRFDVYCEDEDGTCFQVEMQNWSQKFFNKRAVYYSSLVLGDQVSRTLRRQKTDNNNGKWDYNFHPLFVLSFLNFKNWTTENVGNKRSEYISLYRYKDIETGNELGDGTNIVFVDLYRFKKSIEECTSLEDIWIYSLKNMVSLDSCPEKVKGTEIEDLYIQSELAKMTTEQRIKYEEEVMTRNDILNSIAEQLEEGKARNMAEGREIGIAEGRREGREVGMVEGRKEGRKEAQLEIVKKLIADGMTAEKAAEITGIPVTELMER